MGGFFIPGIGAGGGGGGNLPANVITGVQLNPANDGLIFTYSTGATTNISLNDIVENLTADQIKDVRLDGKTLVVEQVDGTLNNYDLKKVLDAVDINFAPTGNIQSTNVQDAIVELNGKFIEDITFDTAIDNATTKPKNTLKKTKNGTETNVINHVVTEWKDLEHVEKYDDTNILDYSKTIQNKAIDSSGDVYDVTNGWGVVEFPVVENQQYTLIRQRNGNAKIRFEGADGNKVDFINVSMPIHGGWHRVVFTTPQGSTKAILEVNTAHSKEKDVMIFLGNQLNLSVDVNKPIPFADNKFIQVGTEVSYKFDNSNSNLKSTTVESAIKELDGKAITSVNGQPSINGNATVNAEHIPYDDAQTQLNANNVQDAIEKLKEDMGLLDTSDIHIVQDSNELNNLLQTPNKVKHGDLIYIINSDGVEDYTGAIVGSLNNSIAMIYDNNITGNKLRVFSRFSSAINISADIVTYNNNTTQLAANNVQEAIDILAEKVKKTVITINNETPNAQGNINLSLEVNGDNLEFKVNDVNIKTLSLYTDTEADALIAQFV